MSSNFKVGEIVECLGSSAYKIPAAAETEILKIAYLNGPQLSALDGESVIVAGGHFYQLSHYPAYQIHEKLLRTLPPGDTPSTWDNFECLIGTRPVRAPEVTGT